MNSGPPGFGNAHVSKAIVLACGVASILAQASKASRRSLLERSPVLQLVRQCCVWEGPAELLFGTFLLYQFRCLERQQGSARWGAFVVLVSALSGVLQLASRKLTAAPAPGGPYGLIFASFVQYMYNVPPLSKFSVLGWRLNDKAFIYLAGLQLCLSGGSRTMLAGAAGLLAGAVYRSNVLGLRTARVPKWMCRIAQSTVGRLLDWSGGAPAPQHAARGPGQAQHNGYQQPRPHGAGVPRARSAAAGPAAMAAGGPTWASAAAPGVRQGPATGTAPPSEAVAQLVAMGFDPEAAAQALRATQNDVQAAITLLV